MTAGKADAVFLSASAARAYQAVHPGEIRAVDLTKPLRIFGDAIMIPQGQFELRQAYNIALTGMIQDGTVNNILSEYEKNPGSFLRVAPPFVLPAGVQ